MSFPRFLCSLLGSFTLTLVVTLALVAATHGRTAALHNLTAAHCTAAVVTTAGYLNGLVAHHYGTLSRPALVYYNGVALLGMSLSLTLLMIGATRAIQSVLQH